jgi:hypothetical protein
MDIRFHCRNGHELHVRPFHAGKEGVCPHCGAMFVVPSESDQGIPDESVAKPATAAILAAATGAQDGDSRRPSGLASPAPVSTEQTASDGSPRSASAGQPRCRPRPERRWYQFYLWHLLLLVTVAAIPCSWLACRIQKADRQHKVVEAIQERGGRVHYVYQFEDEGGWLRGLIGTAALGDLVEVRLDTPEIADEAVARLGELTELETLCLSNTQLTDEGLRHLEGLTRLENLWLDDTFVTDDGLAHLRGLSRLKSLWLCGTQVTDAGLAHLGGLTDLEDLRLWKTPVTDEGVKRLQKALPGCRISRTPCP